MKVQEVMTKAPLAIDESSSLDAALRMMDEHSIRHLPVVERGKLLGIISTRDLLGRTGWRAAANADGASPRCVGEVMTRDVVTVSPDVDVSTAAGVLLGHSIGCLPVMEGGELAGVLSELDLLALASAADGFRLALAEPMGRLIRKPAATVAPWSTLDQVDEMMHGEGVRHVPVIDDGRLVGIVSDHDMRRAEGRGVDPDTAVNSLMTQAVATVGEPTPIVEAAKVMGERRIGAVVVTGRGGEVYVVTTSDVLEYVQSSL